MSDSEDEELALYDACALGDLEEVRRLLKRGALVNFQNEDGTTPLYMACGSGELEIVKELLSKGANINLCETYGAGPVYMAAQEGHIDLLKLLLAQPGVDLETSDGDGLTPLAIAVETKAVDIVRLLIEHGANVDAPMDQGRTPLQRAIIAKNLSLVSLLINSKRCNLALADDDGHTALSIACEIGQLDLLKALLEASGESAGALIRQPRKDGVSPFVVACYQGNVDVVRLLLPHCPEVVSQPLHMRGEELFPLYIACQQNRLAVAKALIEEANADVKAALADGTTSLYIAAQKNFIPHGGVELCEMKRKDGSRALHVACANQHLQIAQIILDAGSDINACTGAPLNQTALCMAAQKGGLAITKLLLSKGANSNAGMPLYLAAHAGHVEVVKELLSAGAHANLSLPDGSTALYMAAQQGHTAVVKVLLEAKAPVDALKTGGVSALHIATQEGHYDIAKALLDAGASQLQTDEHVLPIMIAQSKGNTRLVDLLAQTRLLKQD